MFMELNDLFAKAAIEPAKVIVFRHRPSEPELRKVLPWLAVEKPGIFNAYQRQQTPRVENAMTSAEYVASFIGINSGSAVFVGLYRCARYRKIGRDEYFALPETKELLNYWTQGIGPGIEEILWFDLEPTDFCREWTGRLEINWPGLERSWWRWADRNKFKITSIDQENRFTSDIKRWDELCLSWKDLGILPIKLRDALAQWRGIYLIFDVSDQKYYVGSASGAQNLLGRWLSYAQSGHGGNVELKTRSPENFRFTILQRVSPDMDVAEVVKLEASWKLRLHSGEFGLNRN